MHFLKLKYLLIFLVLVSCKPTSEENEPIPSNVLPEEKFVALLTDAYLAEGASGINVKNANGQSFDSVYLFNPFRDHGISREQFDSSLVFYSQHPKKLKIVYEKVLEKLSEYQSRIGLEKAMSQMK